MTDLKFKSFKEKKHPPFRCVLAGEAGSGKTSTLASLANNGYKLYIIDLDGEGHSGLMERLTDEGKENTFVVSLYGEFNEKDTRKQLKKETAYMQCHRVLDQLRSNGVLNDPNTVLVLDSLTNLASSIKITEETQDGRKTAYESWNEAIMFLGKLFSYTSNCNCIILAHTEQIEVENSAPVTGLDFISKKYSIGILRNVGFNCVYHITKTLNGDGTVKIEIQTAPSRKEPWLKNPYNGIPAVCDPKNFFTSLINYHKTGIWEDG